MAAWALGRLGDRRAVEPLRRSLDSGYRSIRAQSAGAKALRDPSVIGELLERLEQEEDAGLLMAYASALGNLRARGVARAHQADAGDEQSGGAHGVGLEHGPHIGQGASFHRSVAPDQAQPGHGCGAGACAVAASLGAARRAATRSGDQGVGGCFLPRGRRRGRGASCTALRTSGEKGAGDVSGPVLAMCAEHIENDGATQPEYILLALHTLHSAAGK